jgi:uncharacterized membrane protein YesL
MFKRTWSVAWFAIRGTYEDFFMLCGMGFLWFLMAVALPYGVFLLTVNFLPWPVLSIALTALAFVLAPPATAALFNVSWYLARERRIEFGYFWQGFKEYFGSSWKVAGILLVALAILLADAYFFFQVQARWGPILGVIILWVILFLLMMQVYLFPLLIALEEKRLGLMFKNSAQLVLAFPLFCLLILVVALLGTALSVLTFVLLATAWMPFIALLFSRAFVSSWNQAMSIQEAAQTKDEDEDEPAD